MVEVRCWNFSGWNAPLMSQINGEKVEERFRESIVAASVVVK